MFKYKVNSNGRSVVLSANSEWEAKALFQEQFGTWPADDAISLLS